MKQINKRKYKVGSKKESPGHSARKGLQSKTVTKNPVFNSLG